MHQQLSFIKKKKSLSYDLLKLFENLENIGRIDYIRVYEAEEKYAVAQKHLVEIEIKLEKTKLEN